MFSNFTKSTVRSVLAVLTIAITGGAKAGEADNNAAAATHGLSLYGPQDLKMASDAPFPYANPDAPKGGHLNMRGGPFTKLNPYSLRGVPAPLLDLVFETATMGSARDDEPFSEYGHLVEKIELAEDRLSLVYHIRPEARFSDGQPVTADDFVFSFELQQHPEFNPIYRQYFSDIESVQKLDRHTVRYQFRTYNQELPLIAGQMPILPKHIYGAPGADFGRDFDEIAIGSGPYVVDRYEFGKFITVRRNPEWWGRNLPRSQGRYNFNTITAKAFLDEVARNEAFKGGHFDVMTVNSARDWALDFRGPFVERSYIIRDEIPHTRPAGLQGFVFNLRRPLLESPIVRKAIALVFDFPWMNNNMFYGQYTRLRCFFENSPDMTNTNPPDSTIRQALAELRERHGTEHVPQGALRNPLQAPGTENDRDYNMMLAERLLELEGWHRGADGIRVKNGQRLQLVILVNDANWERISEPYQVRLRELGVDLRSILVQPAEFERRLREFDFDMLTTVLGQSRSIGNEQFFYFGSDAADTPGSRNLWGLKNPAVDEVMTRLVAAETRRELVFYGNLLDRILMASVIVVPHWYVASDRVLYWDRFGQPEQPTSHIFFETYARDFWWYDYDKAERLHEAMRAGTAMPPPPPPPPQ